MALIAFNSLIACAGWGGASASRAMKATATAGPTAVGLDSSWKLVWSDEFNGPYGTPPDPNKWTPDIGGGGWGNRQLEYDTDNQNAYQDGQGNLVIEARKGNPQGLQCWYGPCQYTSARITTNGHFSFTYGFLEARIKIPYGQGMWPAFWLVGDNCKTVGWPTCGEFDAMENIGKLPATIQGAVHGPNSFDFYATYTLQHGKFADDFHVFALQWEPDNISFFMDGIHYATLHRASLTNQQDWVYDHPFFVILNVAVGGKWPKSPDSTTVFPQKMYVSYVRVYTKKD
jgi:beta-glucanase (GH16 family)